MIASGVPELNPLPRLLMGPGPVNADPRVLRAMSAQLLGQFDPQFRDFMAETSTLYRGVFQTQNRWTMLIDGTARAAIEAALVSLIEPGDKVLVPIFGRFGHLLVEIATRCGAQVTPLETQWGTVFTPEQIETAIKQVRPKLVALCQGDTSTTMAQPLAEVGLEGLGPLHVKLMPHLVHHDRALAEDRFPFPVAAAGERAPAPAAMLLAGEVAGGVRRLRLPDGLAEDEGAVLEAGGDRRRRRRMGRRQGRGLRGRRPLGRHTLKRKWKMSPSATTYSLPSRRILPCSLAPTSPLKRM